MGGLLSQRERPPFVFLWRKSEVVEQRYVGVKELALYLGIKVSTVYAWTSMRKIPFYKVGRLPRFDLVEISAWMQEQKVNPV